MKTRDLSRAALPAICITIAAAATQSCQIISGLDDLEAAEGTPSGSGSSGSSSGGGTVCVPGDMQGCYSGPPETMGVGVCKGGTQTCEADGPKWGPCLGEVTPQAFDNCADEKDLSCDGVPPSFCTGVPLLTYVGGSPGPDVGHAVAIDSKGNAIFVGEYEGMPTFGGMALSVPPGTGANVFVVKLDPTGNVLWAKSFGDDGYDRAISVAVGKDDTIALTGRYTNAIAFGNDELKAKPGGDIFLAKLDPNGEPLWGRSYGGDGLDEGHGIAVDALGNIFLTGFYQALCFFETIILPAPNNGADDGFVAKITPDGALVWAISIAGGGYEEGFGLTTDSAGDVVVTGRGYGDILVGGTAVVPGNGGNGALVAKLAGVTGKMIWGKIYGPPAINPNQLVYDVARAGGDDDIVITGHFETSIAFPPLPTLAGADGLDVFVAKLDKNGNGIWSQAFTGTGVDAAFEVDVDAFGNILLGGVFTTSLEFSEQLISSVGPSDGFVAKFRPDGSFLWARALNATGGDAVHGVAIEPLGASYITGSVDGSMMVNGTLFTAAGLGDAFLMKLAP